MKRILSLDSRNRTNTTDSANNCTWQLQDTISAAKFELTNFQFAIQCHLLRKQTLHWRSFGCNNYAWLLECRRICNRTQHTIKAFYATVSNVVTLDSSTNILTWVLPSGSITSESTLLRILGILATTSGSFTSNLF